MISISIFCTAEISTVNISIDFIFESHAGYLFTVNKLQNKNLAIFSIIGNIKEEVGLSNDRWSNLNTKDALELLDLFLVDDLGLKSLIFIPKYPSESIKPVNQLLLLISELSKILSLKFKLYLALINWINLLNVIFLGVRSLLCKIFISFLIPSIFPTI